MTVDKASRTDSGIDLALALSCAGLSGLLLAAAFRAPPAALLAWVALVPLLLAVRRTTPLVAALAGAVFGAVFFAILVSWVTIFGGLAVLGMLLYGSLVGAALASGVAWALRRLPLGLRLAAVPALFVMVEWVRSSGSWGFSWGMLGYSQQPVLPVAQFASLAGVLGLTAAIALANAALAELVSLRGQPRRMIVPVLAGLLVISAVVGWGLWRMSVPVATPALKVAGVQPSVDQWAKFDPAEAGSIMRTLKKLTNKALGENPRLVVWPETVIPLAGEEADLFTRNAAASVRRHGADFLYGTFKSDGAGVRNSAVLESGTGGEDTYGKVHLVPFGEYVPLRPLLGNIGLLTMVQTDLTAAKAPVLLRSSAGKVATVICFESSDAPLVRRAANLGAGFVVVITNDGWFKRSSASEQHFGITAFRAIENGSYVVQVSNNGVSGVIDPRGRVLARTRLWDRTIMVGNVSTGRERTPYGALGDLPLLIASAAVLVASSLNRFSRGSFAGSSA